MQLNISGHHLDISDALHTYVTQKIERLEKHYEHITNVRVVLSIDKLNQKAEATVHLSGTEIYADAISEDLYAAIDSLSDKLDRQVLKHKEKISNRHRGK